MRTILPGSTDKSVYLRALDSTDGTPETGIAYNTSGISLWYRRDGGSVVTITPVTLAALTTGHTDGGVLHVNHGNFRLDLPDAALAAGSETVMIGGAATGMIFTTMEIQLKVEATSLRSAVATGGAAGSITLDAPASSGTDFYVGNVIQTLLGTGAGQSRIITAYDGTTKTATVDRNWATNPASGTVFAILPTGSKGMTATEVAQAVLNAVAASYDTAGSIGEKINDSGAAATPPTAVAIAAEIFGTAVATGVTFADSVRGYIAVNFGKSDISGTTYTFRNKEDTKNAVTATVVAGERTAVTLNLTQ